MKHEYAKLSIIRSIQGAGIGPRSTKHFRRSCEPGAIGLHYLTEHSFEVAVRLRGLLIVLKSRRCNLLDVLHPERTRKFVSVHLQPSVLHLGSSEQHGDSERLLVDIFQSWLYLDRLPFQLWRLVMPERGKLLVEIRGLVQACVDVILALWIDQCT
jgi:hypothetical protein